MAFARSEQPNARKAQAVALSARTGLPYTVALQHIIRSAQPWQPKHRWVLTDDVLAWLSGESRRGDDRNLYLWLDTDVSPTFACDHCGMPGDARTADCSISPVVTAYDPDVAPYTRHVATKRFHATCAPSSMRWTAEPEIPAGPRYLSLPASGTPALVGTFEFDVHALVDTDPDDGSQHAMLLLTARVVEDHGRGVFAWLTELELYLGSQGVGRVHDLDDDAEIAWTLRIADDQVADARPPWIAIRTGHTRQDGTPQHLLRREFELPDGWAEAARRTGHVDIAVGPCTHHWDAAAVPEDLDDDIAELLGDQRSTPKRCGCAHLTSEHLVELVESGAFLTGWLRVVGADGVS
ncbi:hypothetical protein AB0A74_26500 [Saccharothrix sp. NPDC042600]|uniref:hypothetical protein n=1 Tax=Saccharothrix TaxID=2071 RepID=UPI003411A21E|nr:hypothetical protein GCM10017745_46360 [Saccharothrix mutabilis subsp. capreolus]